MKEKLIDLIEVRRIIALLVTVIFVVLAFLGKIENQFVENIILMVVTYYFAKETALDKPEK